MFTATHLKILPVKTLYVFFPYNITKVIKKEYVLFVIVKYNNVSMVCTLKVFTRHNLRV